MRDIEIVVDQHVLTCSALAATINSKDGIELSIVASPTITSVEQAKPNDVPYLLH